MEETATETDLGPNKRLKVTKGSRNQGAMKSFVTVHINKQDEDEEEDQESYVRECKTSKLKKNRAVSYVYRTMSNSRT